MRAEDLLPDHQDQHRFADGTVIRKGTVGAFLFNARVWCDPAAAAAQRAEAERDLLEALPALRLLGLFDVLSVRNAALRRLVETHGDPR
jgi:hypothetical protein